MKDNDFSDVNNNEYAKEFSESSFWDKVKKFASKAGSKVIYTALKLYYTMQSPDTPAWAKAVIIGALGYFIAPVDGIPDPTPIVGFADDLGVLAAAAASVVTNITPAIKAEAKRKVREWFGDSEMEELE